MRRLVWCAVLLAGAAWLPAAGADIYVGQDAAGGLVLSDMPFAGARQIYGTAPALSVSNQSDPASSAAPVPADPPPRERAAADKAFLGED
jgi:hypothetical protein